MFVYLGWKTNIFTIGFPILIDVADGIMLKRSELNVRIALIQKTKCQQIQKFTNKIKTYKLEGSLL